MPMEIYGDWVMVTKYQFHFRSHICHNPLYLIRFMAFTGAVTRWRGLTRLDSTASTPRLKLNVLETLYLSGIKERFN